MRRQVLDSDAPVRRSPDRSRWLLIFALASSALVIGLASALIASFFTAGNSQSAASESPTPMTGEPITVALARTPGGSLEWRTYVSAIHRMGDAVGRPMRIRYVESRSDIVDLLLTGRIDAAFMCTYCYLQVEDKPGVALVAVPRIAGQTKDAAVLVVRGNARYGSLADLRGERIGVIGPTSLAGYAYLIWLARERGVDATSSFVFVRGDSQEQNIRALLAKDVEAVVVNRSQLASWPDTRLRILVTSPEFGMPPFVTGPTIDVATRDLMQRALLEMRPASETTPTSIEGFAVPKTGDYDFARTLARYTHRPVGGE